MKVKSLILALILCASTAFAQINLENTYSTDGDDAVYFSFAIENEYFFYTLNASESVVKIYNSSHVLYKTITLPIDAGYTLEKIYLPTDKLFNLDSKIEFIALFSGETDSKMILFNEDGTNLKDFGADRWSAYSVKVSSNMFKLITVASSKMSPFSYDVYSLPGTLTELQESILKSQYVMAFPNPAKDIITISNISQNKSFSIIEIFDENANLVQQIELNPNQSNVNIDISSFKRGLYLYKTNNTSGKFIKQ